MAGRPGATHRSYFHYGWVRLRAKRQPPLFLPLLFRKTLRHAESWDFRGVRVVLAASCLIVLGTGLRACADLPPVLSEPHWRQPVAIALAGHWVVTANTRAASISVLDIHRRRLAAEYEVGQRPVDVALVSGDGRELAVLCQGDRSGGEVVFLEFADGIPRRRQSLSTPVDPQRFCFFGADRLAVTTRWSRRLALYHRADSQWRLRDQIDLPFAARSVCFDPSGRHVLVADAFGGRIAVVPWESPQSIQIRLLEAQALGELVPSDQRDCLLVPHVQMQPHMPTVPERIFWGAVINEFVRGIGWRELLQEDLARRLEFAGPPESTSPSASDNARPIGKWSLLPLAEPGRGAADPSALAVTKDGRGIVCLSGVDRVALIDIGVWRVTRQVSVGRGPSDVALDAEGRLAYVANRFDDTVSVVDIAAGKQVSVIPLGERPVLSAAERGEVLFHDGRLSRDAWFSCRSCHVDGHTTGGLNDNFADGDDGAPKRVLSLLGVSHTAPWAWLGTRPTLEMAVRKSLETTMRTPSDHLSDTVVDDLVAYLRTLEPPPGVARAGGTVDDALARQGEEVFQRRECHQCHQPPHYTSSEVWNVSMPDEHGRSEFNPPSLRGVSQRDRFFHDGRAASLEEALERHGGLDQSDWSTEERRALLHFLQTL